MASAGVLEGSRGADGGGEGGVPVKPAAGAFLTNNACHGENKGPGASDRGKRQLGG